MEKERRDRALLLFMIFGCETAPEVDWSQPRLMFSGTVWSLLFTKLPWFCVIQAKTWGTRVFHGDQRKPLVASSFISICNLIYF